MIEIRNLEDTTQFKISTRLLMKEALRKGYKISYFPSSPATLSGITRCEKDGKEFFFKSTMGTGTPSYGVFAAENKLQTFTLLAANDVNTPDTIAMLPHETMESAEKFLERHGKVVVKPVNLNHGDGISVGVTDRKGLKKAIDYALEAQGGMEPEVLVQQQVEGNEYRFLVVEGKVVAVASRRPPFVIGDGVRTVQQLIEEKNKDPRRSQGHTSELTTISLEDVVTHRGRAFLLMVPKKDEHVQVLDTSNLSRGGEAVDYTDAASSTLKRLAIDAAERCFLGVAGVDIITNDVTADDVSESYVIEVNLMPGIRMHEHPSEGRSRLVSRKIFAAHEKTARPISRRVVAIGRSEHISLPELDMKKIPARIDTGATISSIWASSIKETETGLSFVVCDKESEYYTGEKIVVPIYGKRAVSSSMGHTQVRFMVTLLVSLHGRRIRAKFTLADRSTQIYPILIGRNVLKNKFVVNVATGKPLSTREKARRTELGTLLKGKIIK
jgi:D-alanine-D-alanine ligase-like ATP-grasp enzyme